MDDWIRLFNAKTEDEYVRTEGIEQVNRLNLRLIEDNWLEDLERAAKDRTYLEKLLKEYDIR